MCAYICEYLPNHVKGPPSLYQNSNLSLYSSTSHYSQPDSNHYFSPKSTDFHLTSLFGTLDSLTGDVAAAGAWQAGRNKKCVEVKGRDMGALVSGVLLVSLRCVFSLGSFGVRLLCLVSVLTFGW